MLDWCKNIEEMGTRFEVEGVEVGVSVKKNHSSLALKKLQEW